MTERSLTVYRPTDIEVLDPEPAQDASAALFGAFADRVANAVLERLAPPQLSDDEAAAAWTEAFEDWLHNDPKTGDPRPPATVAAYGDAWRSLRSYSGKEPRHITGLDIRDWVQYLRSRTIEPLVHRGLVHSGRRAADQVGFSPATVNQYLAGISSFYSFCQRYTTRTADGREVILLDDANPAKSHAVKRPKTKQFGQSVVWLD